ncbi:MAG: hypothetical protein IJW77_00440 [Clostridia bacterium]|nr:hypothetical protein [Clostridia bacterium]
MNNYKLRLCAAILALSSVASVFASCGSSDAGDTRTTEANTAADTAAATEEITTDYMPVFPEKDYGGDEFLFLTSSDADDNGRDWETFDIYAETATGDVITDAVYERNMWLEETFNIKIGEYKCVTMTETKKAVQAGVTDYDAVMTAIANGCSLGAENYTLDLTQVPNLDLKQSWWDQGVLRDTSINNRNYIATGDISIVDNEATWVLMFNKQMAQNLDLDLYQMVYDNQWDMETFYKYAQQAVKDLNGDGKMYGPEDQFGFATSDQSAQGLMYASGLKLSSKDADDYPIIDTNLEKLTEVVIAAGEIMSDADTTIITTKNGIVDGDGLAASDKLRMLFEEGRALFFGEVMACVGRMRNSTTDFGLIPFPKYDLAQENYYHFVHKTAGKGVCIPTTQLDIEMAGLIIEAMAAKSVGTVTEAYYDKALTYKYMRDEESAKMLDIILASRIYDLAYIYDWGSLFSQMFSLIVSGKDTVASTWDKRLSAAGKALTKTVDAYKENE